MKPLIVFSDVTTAVSHSLFAHHQDGAVGMPDHRVGDASHQGLPYPAPPPATHHYQPCTQFLRKLNYLPIGGPYPQMCLRHDSPCGLDLLYLSIQ